AVEGISGFMAFLAPGVVGVARGNTAVPPDQGDGASQCIKKIELAGQAGLLEAEQAVRTVLVLGGRGVSGVALEQHGLVVVAVAFGATIALLLGAQATVVVEELPDGGATGGDFTQVVTGIVNVAGGDAVLDLGDLVADLVVAEDGIVGGIDAVGDIGELVTAVITQHLAAQQGALAVGHGFG